METLRDCQTSLLRPVPELETSMHINDTETAVLHGNHKEVDVMRDALVTLETTSSAAPSFEPTPDRFSKDFFDPQFPIKPVPYDRLKRLFDIVFACIVLIVLGLPMIVIAALVKLTSRGPIIFKQVRVGQGGRYFLCYKFRSMCADAEEKKQELMHLNEATGPVFKIKNDPRLTPIGALIRKYSIDELPQFFNVLKGEMSIVGPRPPIPSEVDAYGDRERGRLAVRPGLTCLWQVGGRSNLSFDRWVDLDLEYIETMSFFKDVVIVLKTIPAVLTGSGAH
jgi:lipopolysaccharide/colanic/teichoic acid biosynthesis glycosyltransferase